MENHDTDLAELIPLSQLEIEGVRVSFKKHTKMIAGEYSFYTRKITIREELQPHWFATFTTLHHEYGHHQQRFLVLAIIVASLILSVGVTIFNLDNSPTSSMITTTLLFSPVIFAVLLLKLFYFEQDADQFMIDRIPDSIFLLLSQLEIIAVAQTFGKESLRRSLTALNNEIQIHCHELLG